MVPPPPRSTLFPYTTLFRSLDQARHFEVRPLDCAVECPALGGLPPHPAGPLTAWFIDTCSMDHAVSGDRKSTRLNSSHRCISYAVFCLKKKRPRAHPCQ